MRVKTRTLKGCRGVHASKSSEADIVRIRTERKGIGKLKALLTIFLALLQVAILARLHLWLIEVFSGYLILCIVLDIVTCLYVLASSKNGRSKAVWIMLILILFPFGYILYFLSDENIFFRAPRKRYASILRRTQGLTDNTAWAGDDCGSDAAQACAYLKNACGFNPYKNTCGKYFSSGAQAFDDMILRCAAAERFIFIEYFIIAEGALLNAFLKVLEERAASGVDVRIIYDDMGSSGRLSRKIKKRVKRSGIQMYAFNKLVPIYKIGMNFRDHRKLTVIDGFTAYTGGINIADEYVNQKRMYGYWKDNAVRVDGDAAQGFTLMFLRQWEFVTKKSVDYTPFLISSQKDGDDMSSGDKKGMQSKEGLYLPYAAGLEYREPVARNVYAGAIARANEKIYIMTPYFVPDETITNLLAQKAMSGVDVRIILPGVPDKGYVYLVSLENADKLINSGVKVYTMSDCFVHTKSLLTENCAIIGSVNFDLRSFFQQYENAIYTDDAQIMQGLMQDFSETLPECVLREYVKRRNGLIRGAAIFLLQLFAPMM